MRFLFVVLIAGLLLVLATGCSDKQKEAEALEQEMKEMETGSTDTAVEQPVEAEMSEEVTETVADAAAVPEEEEVAEAMEPMPEAPIGDGYTVQVASCKDEDYARYLVQRYSDRGYDVFVTTYNLNGQVYHRVRIGNYATLTEAKAAKAELVDKYSLDPWIDKL